MRSFGVAALAVAALAVPGKLDPTFGSGGKVLTQIGDGSAGQAIALQRDGKLVVAGFAGRYGSNTDFEVARYTPRGRLDRSFGQKGMVATDFGTYEQAAAVKIQPDGRIVVAGYTYTEGSSPQYAVAVARYRRNGSLDSSFGAGGKVVEPGVDFVALVLQRDGKIVVGGQDNRDFAPYRFALYRLNHDGSLDTNFGTNGEVTTQFEPYSAGVSGLAIQPDGKIVALGSAGGHDLDALALARYNRDGSLDTTFGSGGKVFARTGILSQARGTAVVLQGKRRILAAGGGVLAGFRPNGRLDPSFGLNRGVTRVFGPAGGGATALAMQRDGTIVAVGASPAENHDYAFGLARFDQNGIPLTRTATSLSDGNDAAYGLVVQHDGKPVAAGVADENGYTGGMIALVRYRASPSCKVPKVRTLLLAGANRALVRAHCSLGQVTRAFSSAVQKGRVISQRPAPGALRPEHAPVRLVVSSGRR